jgi:hypothetical protein
MAYGDKRDFPTIETWVPGDTGKGRPMVTTSAETVWEARKARAAALGVAPCEVAGRRTLSSAEVERILAAARAQSGSR